MIRFCLAFFQLFLLTACSEPLLPPTAPPVVRPTSCVPLWTNAKISPPYRQGVNNAILIIIDPGHGGEDYGTHSLGKPVYHEKYLTLSTAKLLNSYLQNLGYRTLMTRETDIFIPLEKRAEMANNQSPTLFVSVHYNSAPNRDAQGIEVFYYRNDTNSIRVKKSKVLAEKVLSCLIKNTKAKDRGIKNGNFCVIRETAMPAILIEAGFLTNQEELEKIKTSQYIKSLAWGIAQGIDQYLKTK